MATTAGEDFPNPLVERELKKDTNTDFLAHDDFSPSKIIKEKAEAEKEEKKDWMENFKTTLVVSGIVIAVIGAVFAAAKKIKEA